MKHTAIPGTAPEIDSPELEPVYFGSSRELFGCLHAPASPQLSGRAVLICPPIAAEYVRCYRPLRLLAAMLADAGLPVLRFDYFGTGDSLGDIEDAGLERWLDDISQAVRYLRGRTRAMEVALVGVRIGASLAARYHFERESLRQLVLWDPVVEGQRIVDELRDQSADHARWMAEKYGERPDSVPADGPLDLLGFRFSEPLLDELSSLSLMSAQGEARCRVMILDDEANAATAELAALLQGRGADVRHEQIGGPKVWMSEPHQGIVPHQSLKRVTDCLLENGG
jgi:pimeloyl-ACP methyl ester carboxylesterase